MLQFDQDTLLCGQLKGWLDLVHISTGKVLFSIDLRHVTGNIISIQKTGANEIVLATQKGVFFAQISKGRFGLKTEDLEKLNATSEQRSHHSNLNANSELSLKSG